MCSCVCVFFFFFNIPKYPRNEIDPVHELIGTSPWRFDGTDETNTIQTIGSCSLITMITVPGGRNVTVSLQSWTGHTNMLAVVGALVFTQYWYWFPLAHCLALAFTPTCLIALNAQLKMPKLEFRSNARPSVYAYPAPLEEKKREEKEKVTTAVLSIAAKARRRESERRARDSHEKMDVVSIKNDNFNIRRWVMYLRFRVADFETSDALESGVAN